MKAYLAKDCYGVYAYINKPELIECRNNDNKPDYCWSGQVYDFTSELSKEIESIGNSLIECKDVKEVDITINIKLL